MLSSLKFVPTDNRAPKAGEVKIRVLAIGLNFRVVMDASGMYPRKIEIFGLEDAGVVSQVGAEMPFKVGDAVFGLAPDTFSSYAISGHRLMALNLVAGVHFSVDTYEVGELGASDLFVLPSQVQPDQVVRRLLLGLIMSVSTGTSL